MPTIKEPRHKKRDPAAGSDRHSEKDRRKKRKPKRKISDLDVSDAEEGTPTIPPAAGSKKREEESKRKSLKKNSNGSNPPTTVDGSTGGKGEEGNTTTTPAHRFIVFIGNLPYTTTHPQLQSHFSSLQPSSIRLITGKNPPHTCKGFAFLEFTSYDRMKSCLAKYHHSMFLDRKINVELTAGGGGAKSKDRREKLRAKNVRLNDQRKRRIEEEEKLKGEKRVKRAAEGEGGSEGGVHPSRRGNVKA
ncbi:unnamed protein product [Tuber aestivum]|uniref:RRM domain-containing protein n=1 Tax=Tuber aestivum TaxID=59557 RepID=A0A292Q6U4_9PEZI|nr:unnamed protein product [Tuber aestivum]